MKILVIGSNGQLGSEIKSIASNYIKYSFTCVDVDELDITDLSEVEIFFMQNDYDYCINCAAFTAVDKSEEQLELASAVNICGPINLAEICKKNSIIFIHISTDFVFDGKKNYPYLENDIPQPLNVYGNTKLKGEEGIRKILHKYFIIRTSWLYSSYGNNFVKTMLRLSSERKSISVVNDQFGTPTYARDLALLLIKLIRDENRDYGLYHYSNDGVTSWYEFANTIFQYAKINIDLQPITSKEYPLPAVRPKYTVLDNTKIKKCLGIKVPNWRESLLDCMEVLSQDRI